MILTAATADRITAYMLRYRVRHQLRGDYDPEHALNLCLRLLKNLSRKENVSDQ